MVQKVIQQYEILFGAEFWSWELWIVEQDTTVCCYPRVKIKNLAETGLELMGPLREVMEKLTSHP